MRFTAERYSPEAADALGQEIVGVYHRFAYRLAANLVSSGNKVLDIGCGDGYGATIINETGAEYVGIDVDPAAVAHAKERYAGDFRLYDGVTLPEEQFDLVTCFQVVEHLAAPEPLLEQIAKLEAHTLFTTPNRDLRLRPGERPWNRFHVREFSRVGLETLLVSYFPNVSVSFIRAPEDIEALELARIGRARKLARLDVLGLRYRVPSRLDRYLRGWLRPDVEQPSITLSPDDLWLSKEEGLDLLAQTWERSQASARLGDTNGAEEIPQRAEEIPQRCA